MALEAELFVENPSAEVALELVQEVGRSVHLLEAEAPDGFDILLQAESKAVGYSMLSSPMKLLKLAESFLPEITRSRIKTQPGPYPMEMFSLNLLSAGIQAF